MADDSFDSLRLSLMQDALPVGLAMVDRVRRGGARKMVEAFTGSSDPLQELRVEGEAAARSVRDRLDQVSPGLGNPVMAVNVAVDDVVVNSPDPQDQQILLEVLARIEGRLDALQLHLQKDVGEKSPTSGVEQS
ncbi:hypothetical protein PMIT1342_01922 [Prochlorococcus marinus str. MIT 1342]|uniref:Uncharacterized protein n=1 Tax=Prochlorococcus marinus (strain MIT 9313) TaxID=74547 RepID=Q7V9A7_PROMM|nr:hypothetical protein [Prochlorococcus marinus]MCH2565747.1 hypothetical protein [Prochlorococcus sp. ALOHA_A2.0_51]MEC9029849.1 hypothetical protein [Cyanobacteriota bacterium]KZR70305.1 hypothetical protein PMIT1313_00615 [Prochlorococcus marinus str. MIT 1313]KZR70778.1 hypothetical protein PMIT1318_01918 [Prochlorococcus marinus str. MIT 1318]KZR79977.1 hypothetical protein PMIT1342_01922 [Prochlorococcus marinus str. MIT 1342]|tara:strand:- start:902 stop:1303 length:402 start_codon:yes stop_codon:yes gene_type:complete